MGEATGSLLEILGVLIGFSAVMLLLSMVVTALVQMTQSVLRIRGRNLRLGLATLMQSAGIVAPAATPTPADPGASPLPTKTAKDWADLILNSDALVHVGRDGGAFIGKTRSWIEVEEMVDALKDLGVPEASIAKARRLFARMEKSLSKRFAVLMSCSTIVWSVLVALVFQMNSFSLLKRLSQDPGYRAVLVDRAGTVREEGEALVPRAAGEPAAENARQQAVDALAALSRFDIEPWSEGWAFYVSSDRWPRLGNLLGVLVTAALLTLGAPFWFNQLRVLSNLRDTLPKKKEDAKSGETSRGVVIEVEPK